MKTTMRKLSVLLLAIVMMIGMVIPAAAFAEGEEETGKDPVAGVKIPFGVYEPDETLLHEGSHDLKITCEKVHVAHTFTAEITFSSKNYTSVKIGEDTYEPYVDPETSKPTFMLPVEINEPLTFTAHTTAMGGSDIPYTVTVKMDQDNLKPVQNGALTDGFYTTTINTNKAAYGWRIYKGALQIGFAYPSNDYEFPVTVEIKDGKIANVAYTRDPLDIVANTKSDINYLMWAMDGHYVSDKCYQSKTVSACESYHVDPVLEKNGTGIAEQLIGKTGITGVDTVSAATITSRAIIEAVDKNLAKAERGLKDDPAPELPGPDTTEDVVPADGYYFIEGEALGTDLDDEKNAIIYVKDGQISLSALYVQERVASYSNVFSGTEADALAAGEDLQTPKNYDWGYKYAGTKYSDLKIKSLDKYLPFQIFATSSQTWFNRPMKFDSDTLRPTIAEDVAVTDAFDDMEMVLFFNNATPSEEDAAAAKQVVYDAIDILAKKIDDEADKYTEDSASDVADAVVALKETIASAEATQEDMRDAKNALDDAIADLELYPYTVKEDDGVRDRQNDTTNNVVYSSIGMFRIQDEGTTVTKDGDVVTVKVKVNPLASGKYDRMALIDYPTGTKEEIEEILDDHAIEADKIEETEGPNGQTGEITTLYSPEFTFQIKASEVGKIIPFTYSQEGKWRTKAYYLIVLTDEEVARRKTEIAEAKETATKEAGAAVEAAQAIVDAKADYEPESYAAFEKALNDLNAVLAKEGATATEINEAKAALEKAEEALVKKTASPMTVKAVKKTYKVKSLKKKAATFKAVTVKKAVGKVTYSSKATGKAKKVLKFNKKTGKITVKKGTKKGTYRIKITVKDPGSSTVNAKTISKTVTVKVK